MRQGSLVGPLLLIAIGGLLLAHNLQPELGLLRLAARYWPVLLIAWGSLRLVEILIWAARSRPLPRSGISGSEWTLVILICLVGASVNAVHRFVPHWHFERFVFGGVQVFGKTYDFPIDGEHECGETPKVIIENPRGHTKCVVGDPGVVRVTGRKSIRALDANVADRAHGHSPLEFTRMGNQILVRVGPSHTSSDVHITTDVEISVPRDASVEYRGRVGDIDAVGIGGAFDVSSERAGVRLHGAKGPVRVRLRSSDVVRITDVQDSVEIRASGRDLELEKIAGQVTVGGNWSGDVQFRELAEPLRYEGSRTQMSVAGVPGEIRMVLGGFTAHRIVGPLNLRARSRDVRISEYTDTVEISVERGDVELRPGPGPLASVRVETRAGDILLEAPGKAAFELAAVATRGAIVNDYGPPFEVQSHDRGASMKGATGAGPNVRLTTGRGTIRLHRASPNDASGAATEPQRPKRLPVERF